MSKVNDQLLKVMSILDVQAKLNPKGATMQLKVELFENAPNYEPLLEKLEQEYGVITIEQRPDEKGYGDPDHHMFEMEQPKNYALYMSYFITLKPEFTAFYQAEYLKLRSTTDTLTNNNRTLVIGMMKAIDDEVSITGSIKASINPKQFSDENCKKALAFLKRLGAVKNYKAIGEMYYDDDYERMLPTGQVETFEIEIVLPTFDEVLAELESDKTIAGHVKEKADLNANFEKHIEKAAAKYNAEQKPDNTNKPANMKQPTKDDTPAISKPDIQALQPSSYHDKTGKLNVAAGVDVAIAARGKVKHKNGTKYDQCHLMSCLFKTVNTLNYGVTFSTFLSVKYDNNNKKHIRKIRNTVDEINKKVADKTTAKKLILVHREKIFIDKSYLKK